MMNTLLKTPKAVLQAREDQKGLHIVLEILIFIAVFLVCTLGEAIPMLPVQATSSDAYLIASLFSTAVMILLVIVFCKFIQKRKLWTIGFVKEKAGIEYIKGIVIGFVMFSAAVLICIVTGALKLEYLPETFALSTFLLFVVGFMIQGMAEEVLCRGYFLVSIGRRYSMVVAVIANAVAFGALHLWNTGISPLAIVNLILFGVFASFCFVKTENIWLVGAVHSVWNLVQGNVYGIKVSGMETSCTIFSSKMAEGKDLIHGGAFGLEGGLAVTIVLTVGSIILFLYKRETVQGGQDGND